MTNVTQGVVIEAIHGVEVRDPYRWLENRDLPQTQDWISRQNDLCRRYFSQNGSYKLVRSVVSDTLSVELIDQAGKVGNKIFQRKQLPGQEQAAIWVRCPGESEDRLLVDPTALGSEIAVGILRISVDGSLLAYSVRSSGSDAVEVRIVDVAGGRALQDNLPAGYLRGFKFAPEGDGFYYCIEPCGQNAEQSIKHHRFGHSSMDDLTLFSVPWAAHRRLALVSRDRTLAAVVAEGEGTDTVQDLYIATEGGARWDLVIRGMRGRRWPFLAHGRIFLFDMEEARNGRLIELCGSPDASPRIVVPECQSLIQKCLAVQDGFLISYLADGQPRVARWSADGDLIGLISLPAGGSIELFPPYSEQTSSVFFLHESYTAAPNLWEIDLSTESFSQPRRLTISNENTAANVRRCWYPSLDGTKIPIVLLEPPIEHEGVRPVVLVGYGGFGTAELPRYSRLSKLLVKFGATIARPAIRGGSEFGEAWHQAATRRNKQTAIDDFLAAAQWLFAEGITDPQHLAIMGSSNGGLLVAGAVIQRPEFFKAVVCTGPLTDMIRYERFDHASRWRYEYGTVEDADDFRALLAYSPYHNVKEGIEYPAMLFVTGDADDRCNPAHVRKMAAALQDLPAQRRPIIVDYDKAWGHVPTLSLAERIEALTRKTAFLLEQLGIAIPEGVFDELFDMQELRAPRMGGCHFTS